MLGLFLVAKGMINPILEKSLDAYLREKLEVRWSSPTYHFSYEDIEIDILSERITFTGFSMSPLEEYQKVFFSDTLGSKALKEITADRITVQGIGLMNFLWDKNIEIDEIDVGAVTLNLLVPLKSKKPSDKPGATKGSVIEGISLPGIQKLSLGRFVLGSFDMYQIQKDDRDTLLTFHSNGGTVDGLSLKKSETQEKSYFQTNLKDMVLRLDPQVLDLKKDLYQAAFSELVYTYDSRDFEIRDITFQPREDRATFRKNAKFSYEIYDATVKRLFLEDFDLEDFLEHGFVYIKKMELDSLDLKIFRDKTKPYDTGRKVLLLNQKMEALSFPIHIAEIAVQNSYLKYTEQSDVSGAPLVVDFSDLDLTLNNLTSLTDSLQPSESITLELHAKLDRSIPMGVKIDLPYQGKTFHVSGHTEGASSFASLNNTVLPAVGLRFTSGRLDGLRFDITGTPWALSGDLTLLYHGLEVEIDKPDNTKRKMLSWAANTLLKSANPNQQGRTVVGKIECERVPYKGLGNFVWKGVESGLINSVNPFGNHTVIKQK
jgi:hypothetical protein